MRLPIICLQGISVLFSGTALLAAPITWQTAVAVSTSNDVSTAGTLVEAYNAGSTAGGTGSATTETVNGVTFVGTALLLPGDPSNTTDAYSGDTGDAAYNALLSSIDYGGGTDETLSLGAESLVEGEKYQIQVWFVDTRYSGVDLRDQDFGDGDADNSNDVNLSSTPGQYAVGTFTADATGYQDLEILSGTSAHGNVHITAYQIRQVTVPASIIWQTPVAVSTGSGNSSDVSTNGSSHHAIVGNFADNNTDYTVNGVTFVALPGGSGSSSNDLWSGGDAGDTAYDNLLSQANFDLGGSSVSITLGDGSSVGGPALLDGQSYEVQVWYVEDRTSSGLDARVVTFGDGASGTVDLNDEYAIGNFTASGTTQTLTAVANGFNEVHITAFQIRQVTTVPTPTLTSNSSTVSGNFTVDVNFSETISGLSESDFTVTNGSVVASSLSGSGMVWSIEVAPIANGFVTVALPAGSVTDTDGDSNPNPASNTLEVLYIAPGSDQPDPTLSTSAAVVAAPYVVQIVFSEAITGLELSDFDVSNGTLSALSGTGSSYTILVTPTAEGDVTLTLPANTVTDTDGDQLPNAESNSLVTTYAQPYAATIYGTLQSDQAQFKLYLTLDAASSGLETSDFVLSNGVLEAITMQGRREFADQYYILDIRALAVGDVTIQLPSGSAYSIDVPAAANTASNLHTVNCTADFGELWTIDSQAEWTANQSSASNLDLADGMLTPTADSAQFTSVTKTFPVKRKATTLTFEQSPIWDNWTGVSNVGGGGEDAPILLPVANDDYYFLARGSTGGYHAWHSTDMVNWTDHGAVTATDHRWVTTAEYKDGTFYIYVDTPNDHTPSLYTDTNLKDGVIGTFHGVIFQDPTNGSDMSIIRDDADGRFHLIHEDWSPINASTHSWDSPLAGHVSSPDGGITTDFEPAGHLPAVDVRTTPTGEIGSYAASPSHTGYTTIEYEIHSPGQDAFGDWTSIKIGDRYYLFGDYEGHDSGIRVGRFTSSSIYEQYELVGDFGDGHPDPSVGFAEGQFYLLTQQTTDFVSPGPWVDGVEARAGVDIDGDGSIDQWTTWQTVAESYDHKAGFARVVEQTPAQLDLSSLPEGYGFSFEFRVDDTVTSNVTPIMDRATMRFEPSGFQQWSNDRGEEASEEGDHNGNGIPNVIEFTFGQTELPNLYPNPDGTLTLLVTGASVADGYNVILEYSLDLNTWDNADAESISVSLTSSTSQPNGDLVLEYDFDVASEDALFWRITIQAI